MRRTANVSRRAKRGDRQPLSTPIRGVNLAESAMRAFLPPPAGGGSAATGDLLGAPLILPDMALTTDEPEALAPSRTPLPIG